MNKEEREQNEDAMRQAQWEDSIEYWELMHGR